MSSALKVTGSSWMNTSGTFPLPTTISVFLALVSLLWTSSPASCMTSVSSTPVERYQTAEFDVPHDNGSLRLLAVNVESQDVYVGAVDYIY